MGKEIVYCHVCGNRILQSDFKKGRAVTLLKRTYCAQCATKDIIEEASKQNTPEGTSRPPTTRRADDITPVPKKTRRGTLKRGSPFRKPLLITALAIAVVLILLIIVLATQG